MCREAVSNSGNAREENRDKVVQTGDDVPSKVGGVK